MATASRRARKCWYTARDITLSGSADSSCVASVIRVCARSTPRATGLQASITAMPYAVSGPIRIGSQSIARHDEQRGSVELVDRPQPIGVVVLSDVHHLLLRRHARDRHRVVEATVDADEAAVLFARHQVERQVAERHRYDGIERVRVTGAH